MCKVSVDLIILHVRSLLRRPERDKMPRRYTSQCHKRLLLACREREAEISFCIAGKETTSARSRQTKQEMEMNAGIQVVLLVKRHPDRCRSSLIEMRSRCDEVPQKVGEFLEKLLYLTEAQTSVCSPPRILNQFLMSHTTERDGDERSPRPSDSSC